MPTGDDATTAAIAKFAGRQDKALATLVLSVDTSLLYLIADLDQPKDVWTKLKEQFCKKTWGNKLELRRKLHSLRLNEGDSVQVYMKEMTELFSQLADIDSPLTEEDKVVYLLAGLPKSFSVLVTALEANSEVPKMDMVSERLLHEERKMKDQDNVGTLKDDMVAKLKSQKKGNCYRCCHAERTFQAKVQSIKIDRLDGTDDKDSKIHKAELAAGMSEDVVHWLLVILL